MRLKRYFFPYRAKAPKQDDQLCFVVSRAAIYGQALKKTAPPQPAHFATRILSAQTDKMAASTKPRKNSPTRWLVFGQPLMKWPMPILCSRVASRFLQLDEDLLAAMKRHGFETAVETNGTLPALDGLDWICVSPKPNSEIVQTRGHELKFVYPQETLSPEAFADLDFEHFYLQPMEVAEDAQMAHHVQASIAYCLQNPQWRLSLQTHKILGLD